MYTKGTGSNPNPGGCGGSGGGSPSPPNPYNPSNSGQSNNNRRRRRRRRKWRRVLAKGKRRKSHKHSSPLPSIVPEGYHHEDARPIGIVATVQEQLRAWFHRDIHEALSTKQQRDATSTPYRTPYTRRSGGSSSSTTAGDGDGT